MEASLRNLAPNRVLTLTCGAFSERWAQIGESCGRTVETLAVPWGRANDPDELRRKLRSSKPFDAVTITHNETSTGVLNPLRELCAAVHDTAPDTLILVDAVTSLAGAEVRFDDWGLDCVFAGTQKCLALPPGLCVFALSERALARAGTAEGRGWLLDFARAQAGMSKGETVATPCVPLIFALSRQLDRIAAEGLPARWARHAAMRDEVTAWAARHGFTWYVAEPVYRSPTVSALNASGRDVQALADAARRARFVLDRGYGKLKGQTFRIGHMGDHDVARVRELLRSLA
jgi:aspartate aminotransferase-like enzyme